MVFVAVGVFGVVDAEKTVQGVFTGVAGCRTGDLCAVHAFLGFVLTSKGGGAGGVAVLILHGGGGLNVVAVADENDFIRDGQGATMLCAKRLGGLENAFRVAVLIFTERVVEVLGGFEFHLNVGQGFIDAH